MPTNDPLATLKRSPSRYSYWSIIPTIVIMPFLLEAWSSKPVPAAVFCECPPGESKSQKLSGPEFTDEREEAEQQLRDKERAKREVAELTKHIEEAKEPDFAVFEERGDAHLVLENYQLALDDYLKSAKLRRGMTFQMAVKSSRAAIGKGDDVLALRHMEGSKTGIYKQTAYAISALILAKSRDEKVKNPKEALDAAHLASAIDPTKPPDVLVYLALAASYSANGNFKAAVEHQEKAIGKLKGKVPTSFKRDLEAYKAGKEVLFPPAKKQ